MAGNGCIKKFEGANVEECLKSASVSLDVPIEKIKFLILEQKKSLFKKHAVISIDGIEGLNGKFTLKENILKMDKLERVDLKEDNYNELNGTIEIKQGKFIIRNPKGGGKPAVISNMNNVTLTVNGEKVTKCTKVHEESTIEVIIKEVEAERHLNLRISSDKMEAYISIMYKPNITYKLKDCEPINLLLMELEVNEEIMPPKFTEFEINKELLSHNIKYGILKMNVMKCAKTHEISELLISKGKKNMDSVDDILEMKYNRAENKNGKKYDDKEVIDYKAIGSVQGVEKGQILAILHLGKNGKDGIDITGKNIVTKIARRILLGVGEGCEIEEKCRVVATTDGRPSSRGNTFFVYKTHKINGNVDLKTGNIQFVGDVIVSGSVHEGMKVEAGNSILVKGNVAEAKITASGDVVVKGNVIHSNVAAGKEDVLTLEYLSDLKSMKNDLVNLISSITQLKEMNLIERGTSDGELVKSLLETKFKKLPQTCVKVARRILEKQDTQDELLFIIKNKILGVCTHNIQNYFELSDAIKIIDKKIVVLEMNLTLPVNVALGYCQDSTIKSSGNIILTGKGEYVSQIVASDSIIFEDERSLARGGVIKAGKEIKCKIVGGIGGVSTKLIVENHGQIWAEIAYQNTSFIIGDREYILDVPSKNVHVYIDDAREFIVDKLQL